MIKKTITYQDDDGQTVTGDFLFHMNRLELLEVHREHNGDMTGHVQQLIKTRNARAMIDEMAAIVVRAYGVRSDDGKNFVKTPELTSAFAKSPALVQLMDELCKETYTATEFIVGALAPNSLT